ncbi:MAG: aldo/keto reductase, partial [Pseudomonadota bacterium]
APPPDTRAGRKDARILESEFRAESLRLAKQIKAHAEAKGISTGQFALNWVLNNRLINSVVVGPRTMQHWQDYLSALDYAFDAEDEAFIDSLVAPGFSSTPFFADVKLPPRGRIARG